MNRMEKAKKRYDEVPIPEELSLQEIAQIMEMNLNTVKSKLYRGLKALRLSLEEVDV